MTSKKDTRKIPMLLLLDALLSTAFLAACGNKDESEPAGPLTLAELCSPINEGRGVESEANG